MARRLFRRASRGREQLLQLQRSLIRMSVVTASAEDSVGLELGSVWISTEEVDVFPF